jgi:hypothetical protein
VWGMGSVGDGGVWEQKERLRSLFTKPLNH